MSRFWFWLQPALAVALLGITIYTLIAFAAEDLSLPFVSIQFVVNGAFVFPGLVISLGVNTAILAFRRPRTTTRTERIMIGVLVAITVILIATSFHDDALVVGLFGWPVLILFAIAVTIVLAVTSARLRQGQPQQLAEDAQMTELFGDDEKG